MATINSVDVTLVSGEVRIKAFGSGSDYLLVRVGDTDGDFGIGYVPEIFRISGDNSLGQTYMTFVNGVLKPMLLGKDGSFITEIWEDLYNKTTRWGRRGIALSSIGAVDIALWDLMGKKASTPVFKILGGFRNEVPAYVNIMDDLKPEALAAKAQSFVEDGFRALKIRGALSSVSVGEATERIKKVREEIGDNIDILVDLNATYSLEQAIRALKRWERYELYLVEEPLHPDSLMAYKRLKRETSIPLAAGEQHGTVHDFMELILNEAVDIIQPDPVYAGGVTEWRRISSLARTFNVPMSPHLNQFVSTHLAASTPSVLWIEYADPANPLADAMYKMFKGPESIAKPSKGTVKPSSAPGFGFEVGAL